MAELGGNKKRSSSSAQNKRVSRFSEVLGAAQSNAQISGYPDEQPPTQQNTQQHESAVGYSDEQPSTQQNTQQPESNQGSQSSNQETQVTGYPDSQPPTQQNTQKTKSSKKVDGQPKTRKPKQRLQSQQSNHEVAGYPDNQPPTQQEYDVSSKNEIPGYPNMQTLAQPTTPQNKQNSSQSKKLAKRENPDYTQTTFRIPKKLSRKIDRAIMDLADSDVEIDRSDLLEELAGAFVRLSEDIGVVKALEQFKNLGIR